MSTGAPLQPGSQPESHAPASFQADCIGGESSQCPAGVDHLPDSGFAEFNCHALLPQLFDQEEYVFNDTIVSNNGRPLPEVNDPPDHGLAGLNYLTGFVSPTLQSVLPHDTSTTTSWIDGQYVPEVTNKNNDKLIGLTGLNWSREVPDPTLEYPVLMESPFTGIDLTHADDLSLSSSMMPDFAGLPQNAAPWQTTFNPPAASSVSGPIVLNNANPQTMAPGYISSVPPAFNDANGFNLPNHMNYNASMDVGQGGPAQPPPQAATAPPGRVICNHPGCGKDFGRAKDRDRHAGKHGVPQFQCTFPSCHRNGAMAFYRQDKLREHLRKRHYLNI